MMPARRPLVAALAATTLTGAVLAAMPAMARPATHAATFSRPMILNGSGAEPSIRVPGDGKSAAYVSAPGLNGSSFWRITRATNRDHSVTYGQSPVALPDMGTGGGDSEISVGDVTQSTPQGACAPIAYSGLHNIDLLDNFTVASSTDCGKTWTFNPYGTENTLTDRQWQVFDGAKTNFLIYHMVSTGQIVVSMSPDAGQHYLSYGASSANGIIEPQLLAQSGGSAGYQQIGNIIVNHAEPITGVTNRVTGEQVHAMYAVFGLADNPQTALESNSPNSGYNGLDSIWVGKSVDGGLTWTDSEVFHVDPSTHRELNMLFPVISSDAAGNLYAAWSDTYKIQYAVSTDHGAHWSAPYQVNLDNRGVNKDGSDRPDAGKADVFPWIAAGSRGLLDVVWYHGEGGAATSNLIYRDPGDARTKWTVAFAQLGSANHVAHGSAAPRVLTYSNAISPVIHYGDICQNGTLCDLGVDNPVVPRKDRSLLDFFQVAVDKEGRANIALADNASAPGQYITAYTQQLSGYSLTTGRPLKTLKVRYPTIKCFPDAAFGDAPNDANEVVVQTPLPSAPALDVTRSYLTWDAAAKKISFHVVMKDISQDPPAGGTGEVVEYAFGVNGKGYSIFAEHDPSDGGDTVTLQSPARTDVSKDITMTIDKKRSQFVFTFPANALANISDKTKRGPVLAPGVKLTGFSITTRRSIGGHLIPNADEASGPCPFVVPRHSLAAGTGAGPGGGGSRYLPSAPSIGGGTGMLLRQTAPALALAGLLGAAAAAVAGRRRRGWVASVA